MSFQFINNTVAVNMLNSWLLLIISRWIMLWIGCVLPQHDRWTDRIIAVTAHNRADMW